MRLFTLILLLSVAAAGALPGINNNKPAAATTSLPADDICGACDNFYAQCLTTCNPTNSDCLKHCHHEVCIRGPSQCHLGERCSRPECSWPSDCNACDDFVDKCLNTCNRVTHECQEGCYKKACVEGPVQCHWGQACQRAECEVPSLFKRQALDALDSRGLLEVERAKEQIIVTIDPKEFRELLASQPHIAKALEIPSDVTASSLHETIEQMFDGHKAVIYMIMEASRLNEMVTDMSGPHRTAAISELLAKREQLQRRLNIVELERFWDLLDSAVQR